MRWVVEVTSLGKTEKESLRVEAETWQKALQSARAQRGENGPMSGFSIELLDDGCRAVDPMSRVRYEVRRAPESSRPSAAEIATASAAATATPPPAATTPAIPPATTAPAPATAGPTPPPPP